MKQIFFSHGWSLSSSSSWWSDDDDDNHEHHRDDPMMMMVQFKDEGAWKCNWALHWNKYARTSTAVSLLSITFKFHFQLSLLSFTFNCHFNNTIYFLFEFNCNNSITFTFVISAAAASFNSQLLWIMTDATQSNSEQLIQAHMQQIKTCWIATIQQTMQFKLPENVTMWQNRTVEHF